MQEKSYEAFRPEWVEQARAGEREAIAALYRSSYQDVCLTVRALLKSDADTMRGLVRDSFQRAFSSLNGLGDAAKFPVWVRILARNTVLDWLRTNCPAAFSAPNTPEIPFDPSPLQAGEPPELPLEQAEAARLTQELLAPLDEGEHLMMGLYYHEGLGIPQIARMTGCREGTIRTRLYTGQRRLESHAVELAQAGADLYRMAPLPLLLALRRRLERTGMTPDAELLQALLPAPKAEFPQDVPQEAPKEYGQTEVLSEEALASPFKAVYQQPAPAPQEDFTPPTEAQQEYGQTEVLSEEELNPPTEAPQVNRQPAPVPQEDFTPPTEAPQVYEQTAMRPEEENNPQQETPQPQGFELTNQLTQSDRPQPAQQPTQDFADTNELARRKAPPSPSGKTGKAKKPAGKAQKSSGSRRRLVIVLLLVLVCLLVILGALIYSYVNSGSDDKTQEAAASGSAAVLEESADDAEDVEIEGSGEAEDNKNADAEGEQDAAGQEQDEATAAPTGTAEERAIAAYNEILEELRSYVAEENTDNIFDTDLYPHMGNGLLEYKSNLNASYSDREPDLSYICYDYSYDGIPELLIFSANSGDIALYAYNTDESRAVDVLEEQGYVVGTKTNFTIWSDEYNGYNVIDHYTNVSAFESVNQWLKLDGWTLTPIETYTRDETNYPDAPYLKESTGERLTEEEYQNEKEYFMENQLADLAKPISEDISSEDLSGGQYIQ